MNSRLFILVSTLLLTDCGKLLNDWFSSSPPAISPTGVNARVGGTDYYCVTDGIRKLGVATSGQEVRSVATAEGRYASAVDGPHTQIPAGFVNTSSPGEFRLTKNVVEICDRLLNGARIGNNRQENIHFLTPQELRDFETQVGVLGIGRYSLANPKL